MEQIIEAVGRFLGSIFGNYNERIVKRYWKIVREKMNPLEERFKNFRDHEFPELTKRFREDLQNGKTLEEIMPEAFAAVREAAWRTIKQRHFDVQLIGGIVLFEGKISEMATGEGKTLTATTAAYLHSLTGRGVHIVTVNDYLARRDTQWMGPIYDFLGVTVACLQHEESFLFDRSQEDSKDERLKHLKPVTRKEAYMADITYGTNNEYGFDYLRDNMKIHKEDICQRDHYYAIVDEVDSILIDEARTPLIISGPAEESADKYYIADRAARLMKQGEDFVVKEKEHVAFLTDKGIEKAEKVVGVDNFYTVENMEWPHYIEAALKAHYLEKKDREYVIKDGEIIIVDEFTGRLMPGRRWSDGLHQAVEAKEGIRVREENQTLATITLQNYFKMYERLSGMTGTAATEAVEFEKIYKLEVVVIPTNKPMVRTSMPDVIYASEEEKYDAVADSVESIQKAGRPVLVGTTSIEKSEYLSKLLRIRGIQHEVLNAKNHEREAQIIAKAGQHGQVTISTNMAGRGTDILLGDGVAKLGGLHVVGTERHEARRIDNQLKGRAGRQGDPGSNQMFLSLEDDLFRKFFPPWLKPLMQKYGGLTEGQRIESKMVTGAIEKAQKNVENYNFEIRKNLLEYDITMNQQRKHIYEMRRKILFGEDAKDQVIEMIDNCIKSAVNRFLSVETQDYDGLVNWVQSKFNIQIPQDQITNQHSDKIYEIIRETIMKTYSEKETQSGAEKMREIERLVLLDRIDDKWKDHLYNMDSVKVTIGLRGYAQIDPKLAYKREASEFFQLMLESIEEDVASLIFKVQEMEVAKEKMMKRWKATSLRKDTMQTIGQGEVGKAPEKPDDEAAEEKIEPIVGGQRTGRNDPCICGSGKKYKKCCGKSAN